LIWGNGFRDIGPSNAGSLRPRARRVAVLGVGAGGGRPPGVTPGPPQREVEIFMPNQTSTTLFPERFSVLWPTIDLFAGAPFRLQNICQNGVPPRSRTNTPLVARLAGCRAWGEVCYTPQLSTGWVDPWVRLVWVDIFQVLVGLVGFCPL